MKTHTFNIGPTVVILIRTPWVLEDPGISVSVLCRGTLWPVTSFYFIPIMELVMFGTSYLNRSATLIRLRQSFRIAIKTHLFHKYF